MKTIEEVVAEYKVNTLDGRDISRLAPFCSVEQATALGFEFQNPEAHVVLAFTREAVLEALRKDVAFGFEKALSQRGISSSLMHDVVMMWNWILEEGLETFEDYAQYGLPLFKATAVKYGFPNEIGDKGGNEEEFAARY